MIRSVLQNEGHSVSCAFVLYILAHICKVSKKVETWFWKGAAFNPSKQFQHQWYTWDGASHEGLNTSGVISAS